MRRKERPLPWLRYLIEAMADQECGASQDGFIRHSFRDRVQIFWLGLMRDYQAKSKPQAHKPTVLATIRLRVGCSRLI